MIAFLKKYKAFLIGLVVTRILVFILEYKKVILIDDTEYLSNILGFVFYWFLISIFIHKIQYLKEHYKTVLKIIGLFLFFILIMVFDSNASMPDNPLTILLILIFYLSITFVLAPKFFNHYKIYILGTYGLAYSIFLYFRIFAGDFETYQQQKTELFLLFFAPIPIFFSLWIYTQWKWFQNLKSEKAKAELAMLQAQINPHFFFNTLNNLYALTITNSKQAPEVILKLSDMMRYTIYEGKKDHVPVKDEIEYLTNYIELHKIRYRKSVDIQFKHDLDENLKVAPLLFIIPLENAFKHGVESLAENAYIHIDMKSDGKEIFFQIENNYEVNDEIEGEGIGLENLKRRLELHYGKAYNLTIEKEPTNYKITLKIPVYA